MKDQTSTSVDNADELGLTWRKSSHSGGNGDCVELAAGSRVRYVRDSKDPNGPALGFSPKAFQQFLDAAAAGEFDLGLV